MSHTAWAVSLPPGYFTVDCTATHLRSAGQPKFSRPSPFRRHGLTLHVHSEFGYLRKLDMIGSSRWLFKNVNLSGVDVIGIEVELSKLDNAYSETRIVE